MLYHLPLQSLLSSPLLDWTQPQFLREISESGVTRSHCNHSYPTASLRQTLPDPAHHSSFFLLLRKFSFADLFTRGNIRPTCGLGEEGICRKQEKLNWDILIGMVKNFLQRRQSIVCRLCPLLTTPKKVTISWRERTWLWIQAPNWLTNSSVSSTNYSMTQSKLFSSLPVSQIPHPKNGGNNYMYFVELWWRLLVVKIIIRHSMFF